METKRELPIQKNTLIAFGIGLIVLVLLAASLAGRAVRLREARPGITPVISFAPNAGSISYPGRTGVDALTLLKEHAVVKQDASGMVVSINGREAKAGEKEYWEFLVDGKPSSVGAQSYRTKNGDSLLWKIATY